MSRFMTISIVYTPRRLWRGNVAFCVFFVSLTGRFQFVRFSVGQLRTSSALNGQECRVQSSVTLLDLVVCYCELQWISCLQYFMLLTPMLYTVSMEAASLKVRPTV